MCILSKGKYIKRDYKGPLDISALWASVRRKANRLKHRKIRRPDSFFSCRFFVVITPPPPPERLASGCIPK